MPPGRTSLVQPVGRIAGGAAFDLPEQALLAVDVDEPGVPAVGQLHIFTSVGVGGEPRAAATSLVDAQYPHRRQRLLQHRIGLRGERLMDRRPGQPRLLRGDRHRHPQLAHQVRAVVAKPGRQPRPGRDLRQ